MNKEEEQQQKAKITFYKIGWIIALCLVFFILGMLLKTSIVGATMTWPLDKITTCNLFNLTGTSCDSYWCENILDMQWDSNNSLCINVINNTVIINNTINVTINETNLNLTNSTNVTFNVNSSFWNESINPKDYIDEKIDNLTVKIINVTSDINLKIGLLNTNGTYSYYEPSQEKPWPPIYWVIIVIVIMGSLCFMTYAALQKKETQLKMIPRDAVKQPFKGNGPTAPDHDALEGKPKKQDIKLSDNVRKSLEKIKPTSDESDEILGED